MPTKTKTITLGKFTEGIEGWHAVRWTVDRKYGSEDGRFFHAFTATSKGLRYDMRWADRKGTVQDDGSWVWDGIGRLKIDEYEKVASIVVAPLSAMIADMLSPGAVLSLRDFERGGHSLAFAVVSDSLPGVILRRGQNNWTDRLISDYGSKMGRIQEDRSWSWRHDRRSWGMKDPFGKSITSITASY